MGDRELRIVKVRSCERRPHPGALLRRLRKVVDPAVRLLRAGREPLGGGAVFRQALLERLDRDPRRDLARLSATHPVGDDKHRSARECRVLVDGTVASGVGLGDRVCCAKHPEAIGGT